MRTAPVIAPEPPELLPIWVRLRLRPRGIPFASVTGWHRIDADRVVVLTAEGHIRVTRTRLT